MQTTLYGLRKQKGLTQRELANKLGISELSYRNKELGKNEFTQDEMFFLSSFFGEKMDNIFLPRKEPKRKLVKTLTHNTYQKNEG